MTAAGGGITASQRRHAGAMAAALALVLGLGISDVPKPAAYDSTVYLAGARGLLQEGAYRNVDFVGHPSITAFPPLTSALMLPSAAFRHQVAVARVLMLAIAAATSMVVYAYARTELPHAGALFTMAAAVLPLEAYFSATTVSSEWPFMLFAFLFLLWERRSAESSRPASAGVLLLGAVLLACAILCRWVGLTLALACGVQVLVDAWAARRPGLLLTHRLVRVVAMAGVPVAAWGLRLMAVLHGGNVQRSGFDRGAWLELSTASVISLAQNAFAVLFSPDRLARIVPGVRVPMLACGVLLCVPWLVGLVRSSREGRILREAYLALTLALLLCVTWKDLRYFVPLAPLLVMDFVRGWQALLPPRAAQPLALGLASACLAYWLAGIGWVLARGDGQTYAGTLVGWHRTARELYRGPWQDVAVVADELSRDMRPGEVFATREAGKHLAALTRHEATWARETDTRADLEPATWLAWDVGVTPLPELHAREFPVEVLATGAWTVRRRSSP